MPYLEGCGLGFLEEEVDEDEMLGFFLGGILGFSLSHCFAAAASVPVFSQSI